MNGFIIKNDDSSFSLFLLFFSIIFSDERMVLRTDVVYTTERTNKQTNNNTIRNEFVIIIIDKCFHGTADAKIHWTEVISGIKLSDRKLKRKLNRTDI